MIFVSSSCVKSKHIRESVQQLVDMGFRNIELSGGTQPYDGMVQDLIGLKEKYGLNYLLHNYFPPPAEPFVVNLAALDNLTFQNTLSHLKNSLKLSQLLKADKFGFHAGFLISIPTSQMGKEITKQQIFDPAQAMKRFCEGYNELQSTTNNTELYLENNVLSSTNYKNFDRINPFFFTDWDSFHDLAERISFKPLVDVAHLKVSCQTLNLNFAQQLDLFLNVSDYIHISDNDGLTDANLPLVKNSELFDLLSLNSWKGKTVTLEVYTGMNDLETSYKNMEEIVK